MVAGINQESITKCNKLISNSSIIDKIFMCRSTIIFWIFIIYSKIYKIVIQIVVFVFVVFKSVKIIIIIEFILIVKIIVFKIIIFHVSIWFF